MKLTPYHAAFYAAAALAALARPAAAETLMLPGAMCTAEGAIERSVTGLAVNKVTTAGTTAMNCPLVRTQPAGLIPMPVTVRINARTNGGTGFHCQVRSVTATNGTFDLQDVVIPSGSVNGSYWQSTVSLILPPASPDLTPATISMRCQVPNASTVTAGIVSYGISD